MRNLIKKILKEEVDFDWLEDSLADMEEKIYYHPTGEIRAKGHILKSSGQRIGLWQWYNPNGNLELEGYYERGQKMGPWRFYYLNGNLYQEGSFGNGQQIGTWRWYDENGNLEHEKNY